MWWRKLLSALVFWAFWLTFTSNGGSTGRGHLPRSGSMASSRRSWRSASIRECRMRRMSFRGAIGRWPTTRRSWNYLSIAAHFSFSSSSATCRPLLWNSSGAFDTSLILADRQLRRLLAMLPDRGRSSPASAAAIACNRQWKTLLLGREVEWRNRTRIYMCRFKTQRFALKTSAEMKLK